MAGLPNWVDKLSAFSELSSAIIALISATFVVYALRQTSAALKIQNTSSDIQTVLSLWKEMDSHWRRFLDPALADSGKMFEFGQLIGYYELACALFRDRALSTSACRTLSEHLDEILPAMRANEEFNRLFEELKSQPDTFDNIRWFCDDRHFAERVSGLGRLVSIFGGKAASTNPRPTEHNKNKS